MKLTPKQVSAFWRQLSATSVSLGLVGKDVHAWRKRIILEECKVDSLTLVDRGAGYARLMRRLCEESEDYEAACYWMLDSERRLAVMAEREATQIWQIQGRSADAVSYVSGVLQQAGIQIINCDNTWWFDCDINRLRDVCCMLDTHRRRLLRASGWRGIRIDGSPLGFSLDRVYTLHDGGCVTYYDDPDQQAMHIRYKRSVA